MNGMPSGTVTMLFSDIEGSTLLLARLGDAYAQALDTQRAVHARGLVGLGRRPRWAPRADSFFVVFATAGDAVAAAVQAQRELAAQHWPARSSGCGCASASIPARRWCTPAATWAWTCTGRLGSPRPRTAGKW